jgi:hypothetical protein
MVATKTIFIACVVTVLFSMPALMPQSSQRVNCVGHQVDCGICDTTAPAALTANGGDGIRYSFTHTADVDALGSGTRLKYRYQHAIHNLRNTVLFAEWNDGGLTFQQIAPTKCGLGDSESGIKWQENPNSMIRYGLTKELSDRASAYLPAASSRQIPATEISAPPLRSHLAAMVTWKDKPSMLDVLIQTQVFEDLTFEYRVTNNGADPIFLTVPGFTSRWAGYTKIDEALKEYGWPRAGKSKDEFRVPVGAMLKLPIFRTALKAFSEERIRIDVGLQPDDSIANMTISLYLPPAQ